MSAAEAEFTALIPAAGRAERLGRLPGSKELLPVGVEQALTGPRVRVAIDHTLDCLASNGVKVAHIIVRPGKWDIPAYVGDGARHGLTVGYLVAESSQSVPQSLDCAFDVVSGRNVVLLFPDIVISPAAGLGTIMARQNSAAADVTLALVPSTAGDKVDIVSIDDDGQVLSVAAKPGIGVSGWTWIAAAWRPAFTELLHREVAAAMQAPANDGGREIYVGDIINTAIKSGLAVQSVCFPDGTATDIGSLDSLADFWQSGI